MPVCNVIRQFTVAAHDGMCWWYGCGQFSFTNSQAYNSWWRANFDGAPIMDATPLTDPGERVLSPVPPWWWVPWLASPTNDQPSPPLPPPPVVDAVRARRLPD
jgi:hypothetical protein